MLFKHRTRIIGLSLLAAVAAMAVSASAAQGAFKLLLELKAVSSLQLDAQVLSGTLLVPGLGVTIHCTGGTATGNASESGGVVAVSGTVKFSNCLTLGGGHCHIVDHDGTPKQITATASNGTLLMDMETGPDHALLKGDPFAVVLYVQGTGCLLDDADTSISGSVLLTILEPEADATQHLVHVDEEDLFFGEEPATLDGGLAHVFDSDPTKFWSIDLI